MKNLLKHTYLLEPKKVEKELEKLWDRYEELLDDPSWENLNEARAILYIIGAIYTEDIAPKAIERRLHLLKKPMDLLEFFTVIDSKSKDLKELRKDPLFKKLEEYYEIIKKNKNRFVGGKHYMNEEKFIDLYNKYNPEQDIKIREMGRFGDGKETK